MNDCMIKMRFYIPNITIHPKIRSVGFWGDKWYIDIQIGKPAKIFEEYRDERVRALNSIQIPGIIP